MRPHILLTGFWSPTNEMLRPFSTDPKLRTSNSKWIGKNWENLGFDIYSYFPEFPENTMPKGTGTFRVDYDAVKNDLEIHIEKHHPVSIISFGKGKGAPWELELNYPDYWSTGIPTGHSTLPLTEIKTKLDECPALPKDFTEIDSTGDTGDFVCGYTGLLLSTYSQLKSAGFIHVNTDLEYAKIALDITLKTVIISL